MKYKKISNDKIALMRAEVLYRIRVIITDELDPDAWQLSIIHEIFQITSQIHFTEDLSKEETKKYRYLAALTAFDQYFDHHPRKEEYLSLRNKSDEEAINTLYENVKRVNDLTEELNFSYLDLELFVKNPLNKVTKKDC